ncbi:MAG: cupredoxin domain-containing protein, partial [Gemmatimonadaceae bacterium]
LGAGTLSLAAACGGGGGDGDGGPGPSTQQTLNEIRPGAPTVTLNAGTTATIQMTALDTQGGTISNPGPYTFQSANPATAAVTQQGLVLGIASGTTSINISLTRTGVTKTASVAVTVTGQLGMAAMVAAGTSVNTFEPQVVAIKAGGTVTWSFGAVTHNVTFSGPQPTGGNIPNVTNTTAQRTFPNTGDYPYDCTLHAGMVGTVFVR